MNSYLFISHPKNKLDYSIYSPQGKLILKKYIYNHQGGGDQASNILFDPQAVKGSIIPCFVKSVNHPEYDFGQLAFTMLEDTNKNLLESFNKFFFIFNSNTNTFRIPLQINIPPFNDFYNDKNLKQYWSLLINLDHTLKTHQQVINMPDPIAKFDTDNFKKFMPYVIYILFEANTKNFTVKYEPFTQYMTNISPYSQFLMNSPGKNKPDISHSSILTLKDTNIDASSLENFYNLIILFNIIHAVPFDISTHYKDYGKSTAQPKSEDYVKNTSSFANNAYASTTIISHNLYPKIKDETYITLRKLNVAETEKGFLAIYSMNKQREFKGTMYRPCKLAFGDDVKGMGWYMKLVHNDDDNASSSLNNLKTELGKKIIDVVNSLLKDFKNEPPTFHTFIDKDINAKKLTDTIWLLHLYRITTSKSRKITDFFNDFSKKLNNPVLLDSAGFNDLIRFIKSDLRDLKIDVVTDHHLFFYLVNKIC